MVHGIDTTVIVDVFSRLHGGSNAAVLRAMFLSTSSRSMITPTRFFGSTTYSNTFIPESHTADFKLPTFSAVTANMYGT